MLRINPDPKENARDIFRGRSGYRLGFIRGPLRISLGIYTVAAREISWAFSGGRSGYRLGFIWGPLGILLRDFCQRALPNRSSTPPGQCTLSLAIFCDGITPRGPPNVNIKAALVEPGGTLFPFVENIPETTGFLTWREMSKVDYSGWVAEHRPREWNTLAAQPFVVPVRFAGCVHRVQVTVAFQSVIADHHQLWWELGGRACVVCPWERAHGVRDMFLHEPLPIHERPCTKFAGTTGLQNVFPMQPVLHNIKGAISRACSVVGRVLSPADANLLFQYLVTVAKRYGITKLPVDSRHHRSLVQRRFRTGVSLTRREAR